MRKPRSQRINLLYAINNLNSKIIVFVVLLYITTSCVIGQVFTQTREQSRIIQNRQDTSQILPTSHNSEDIVPSVSTILSSQNLFLSKHQEESLNAQKSSNNRYKNNDQLSTSTLNNLSSITSSLDNDLYHMSFTPEELMETNFPHNMSRDIDMDPCKSGNFPILCKILK